MWFSRKKQAEVEQLSSTLELSFRNVRQDVYNIFSWLNYLNERILSMQKQLEYAPKSKEEVKQIIDSYYSYGSILNKIDELNERLENVMKKQREMPEELDAIKAKLRTITVPQEQKVISEKPRAAAIPQLDEINDRLIRMEEQRKKNMRETMAKKLTRNSKDYVKNVIVSLIRKYGKIPALKLKEMIVDEQGLCSKSSFYRLLNEVQEEAEVSIAHKGKEKEIVFKIK